MRSCSARSLTLVRCSAFIAWGGDTRRFHQLILSLSHQGKAAAMMAAEVLPCVSSLVPSCVSLPVSFSCSPASRPVPRLVPSCPMCRTACRPSCGRAVLFSLSRRFPYSLSSSSPHDRMTQDGNGYRIMATKRTSNRRTSRRKRAAYLYRVDIGTRPTPQERPIQIRKAG